MKIEITFQPQARSKAQRQTQSKPASKNQVPAAQLSSKNRQTLSSDINAAVEATIKHLKLSEELAKNEISVVITDNHEIQSLNNAYRKKDYATNVLSFPFIKYRKGELMEKKPFTNVLGEMVLSLDKCAEEALDQKKDLNHHIIHLIIHSTLHLLGFDHEKKKQAEQMEEIEIEILKKYFKIPNPYA